MLNDMFVFVLYYLAILPFLSSLRIRKHCLKFLYLNFLSSCSHDPLVLWFCFDFSFLSSRSKSPRLFALSPSTIYWFRLPSLSQRIIWCGYGNSPHWESECIAWNFCIFVSLLLFTWCVWTFAFDLYSTYLDLLVFFCSCCASHIWLPPSFSWNHMVWMYMTCLLYTSPSPRDTI